MPFKVQIASPCSEKWESMQGDERVRFCAKCRLDVFNLREMTEADARALLFKGQRVCGRVYQRPDGTVLTKDCPTGLAKVRRRALAAVTMAAAMVLAVVGFRSMSKKGCATDGQSNWFGNTFGSRYVQAKEALRGTETFGPIIEELDPQHVVAGDMLYVPSSTPTGG